LLVLLLSFLAAVAVGSLIMVWYKQNPIEIYRLLLRGAYGSQRSIFISLQRATPLIFTALASTLAFRTGVFNVGVEGQFFIGAIAGTYVGFRFDLPTIIHLPLALLAGFAAGAIWAYFPTILRQRLRISEIVTTIMTNYIATFFISYLVNYPLRDAPTAPESPPVLPSARLPQFVELTRAWSRPLGKGSQAHVGILLALVLVALLYIVFRRTKLGYEWRMAGISFPFAEFVGVNLDRTFITGMLVSGGIAGLGGAVEILGVWREYKDFFAFGFGFRGNLSALLGGRTVIGSALAALFYGSMEAGALGLEWAAGIPRQLIDIAVSLIFFFMAAEGMWDILKRVKWVGSPARSPRTKADAEA
jgi:simple sugar transport system permease protein